MTFYGDIIHDNLYDILHHSEAPEGTHIQPHLKVLYSSYYLIDVLLQCHILMRYGAESDVSSSSFYFFDMSKVVS